MSQTKLSAAQSNKAFFGLLEAGQTKEAQDMVSDFTRIRIRESSAFEKIMPGVKIGAGTIIGPNLKVVRDVPDNQRVLDEETYGRF